MNQSRVTVIPAIFESKGEQTRGTPGKIHVEGYTLANRGTRPWAMVRKDLRGFAAAHTNWEITGIAIDYRETEDKEGTNHVFPALSRRIKNRELDILIVHSGGNLDSVLLITYCLLVYCEFYSVQLYVAHNGLLLSEDDLVFPESIML
ncbi:hypothetical protein [Youngiibacter multivorans]|uniref:Uncharacterized protein n=1 Tax=Youngiibacter multivorans TaxID=937251 RepID=A0ABS4G6T4_9CLOT|nr:hypothetical protein [Youngiibacter multivorans]MBP1920266.1 hypothetical protein [Youngiibacter multivorans]